jgi:hypothetical protein
MLLLLPTLSLLLLFPTLLLLLSTLSSLPPHLCLSMLVHR